MEWEVGGRFKREATYVYLWLIHVDVWQKPVQYCKANYPPITFFFFKERSIGLKALDVVGTEVGNAPAKLDQVGGWAHGRCWRGQLEMAGGLETAEDTFALSWELVLSRKVKEGQGEGVLGGEEPLVCRWLDFTAITRFRKCDTLSLRTRRLRGGALVWLEAK